MLTNNYNVLTVGPTGTGKSLNIYTMLTYQLDENY